MPSRMGYLDIGLNSGETYMFKNLLGLKSSSRSFPKSSRSEFLKNVAFCFNFISSSFAVFFIRFVVVVVDFICFFVDFVDSISFVDLISFVVVNIGFAFILFIFSAVVFVDALVKIHIGKYVVD